MLSAQTIWFSAPLSPLKTTLVSGPSAGVSLRAFEPAPSVEVQDALGTLVHHTEVSVTASILRATIDGRQSLVYTERKQTQGGAVSFPSLTVTASGRYLLKINSWGMASDMSTPFHVSEGEFAQLKVAREPSLGVGGLPLRQQPIVTLQDRAGNALIKVAHVVSISFELLTTDSDPVSQRALLSESEAVSVLFGVASFTNITVGPVGMYILRFVASQAPTLGIVNASILSAPFSVITGKPSLLSLAPSVGGCVVHRACRQQPVVQVGWFMHCASPMHVPSPPDAQSAF